MYVRISGGSTLKSGDCDCGLHEAMFSGVGLAQLPGRLGLDFLDS